MDSVKIKGSSAVADIEIDLSESEFIRERTTTTSTVTQKSGTGSHVGIVGSMTTSSAILTRTSDKKSEKPHWIKTIAFSKDVGNIVSDYLVVKFFMHPWRGVLRDKEAERDFIQHQLSTDAKKYSIMSFITLIIFLSSIRLQVDFYQILYWIQLLVLLAFAVQNALFLRYPNSTFGKFHQKYHAYFNNAFVAFLFIWALFLFPIANQIVKRAIYGQYDAVVIVESNSVTIIQAGNLIFILALIATCSHWFIFGVSLVSTIGMLIFCVVVRVDYPGLEVMFIFQIVAFLAYILKFLVLGILCMIRRGSSERLIFVMEKSKNLLDAPQELLPWYKRLVFNTSADLNKFMDDKIRDGVMTTICGILIVDMIVSLAGFASRPVYYPYVGIKLGILFATLVAFYGTFKVFSRLWSTTRGATIFNNMVISSLIIDAFAFYLEFFLSAPHLDESMETNSKFVTVLSATLGGIISAASVGLRPKQYVLTVAVMLALFALFYCLGVASASTSLMFNSTVYSPNSRLLALIQVTAYIFPLATIVGYIFIEGMTSVWARFYRYSITPTETYPIPEQSRAISSYQ